MGMEKYEQSISIPEGIKVRREGRLLIVEGKRGSLAREFFHPLIQIREGESMLTFASPKATKREKRMIGTFAAHLQHMIQGVQEGHRYRLRICSGHFPMNVTVSGAMLSVKNFLGEKVPRTMELKKDVQVKVEGSDIVVESADKELAGQTAAAIELLTRIQNRDRRIFQDGIFIIEKDGKPVA